MYRQYSAYRPSRAESARSSYSTSQVVSTSILAVLGTTAISTKIYLSTIFFLCVCHRYVPGDGHLLIIGWMTGAGEYDKAYRLNLQNLRIAVLLNAAGSTLICLSVALFWGFSPKTRKF